MVKRAASVAQQFSEVLGEAADNLTKEAVEEAAVRALIPVALDAKANAPVDTGELRDSIVVKKMSDAAKMNQDEGFIGAVVGPTVFYGIFVEIGANQPAQPYLRSAFDSNRGEMMEIFRDNLDEQLFG